MAGSDESVFLSVVVPAYNEDARLGPTLRTIRAHLESRINAAGTGNGPTEIIVVDDGSTDRTGAVAAEALRGRPRDRVLRRGKNRGKGFSVKEGMLAAAGRLILFTDADLSTPITELEKLLAGIRDGHDIVIGSRALPGAEIRRRQRVLRERMGKTFNLFVRGWVLKGFPDTQCGFKLFRRE
ncbi:MAG TPA: glycosyltransferase, partial [Candidatus Aminicenantes bacterium]|nr:glycosyltransferase [Candidatus Aminicenantes bacterium]